jgi:hypothetical protein
VKKALSVFVVLAVVYGIFSAVRASGSAEQTEADARPLFVPVILTPSVQPANGQVVLYKATNASEYPINFRLTIYKDDESVPGFFKDFLKVPPAQTVSYVYEPIVAQLQLGAVTLDAPVAVRAVFAPVPGEAPGAIRNVVANVQLMRVQTDAKGAASLDPPIVVPLSHCNFEPRGFVPYTGGRWYWNCAPDMYPLDAKWRELNQQAPRLALRPR